MASTDTDTRELDPAEMQSDCSVGVARDGWDVTVDVVRRLNDEPG